MRLNAIQHFFEHYKDLESGKWVKVNGWGGIDDAHQEILTGIKRYQAENNA
jgi:inorganic pyrophosphatase